MKRIHIILILALLLPIGLVAQEKQNNFEIAKSLDIYNSLLRELNLNYVDEINPGIRNIQNVRVEHTVEASEILKVKRALEKERNNLSRSIITYHLDKDNINRYKPETYEEIYRH